MTRLQPAAPTPAAASPLGARLALAGVLAMAAALAAPAAAQPPEAWAPDVAEPGTPGARTPARLLVWVAKQQLGSLALGVVFGILWMVAQALMPYTIGRGIQEGIVEDDAAIARLAELGCEHAQGYGIGKPMPQEQLLPWLSQRRSAGRATVVALPFAGAEPAAAHT